MAQASRSPLPSEEDGQKPPIQTNPSKRSQDSSLGPSDDKPASKAAAGGPGSTPDIEYPPLRTVILLMASLFMAAFLVALDRTIVATAIPVITDQFKSLGSVGWYASAYLLTMCSFQLIIGRIYTFYNPKLVWLICISIFEVGSAVCGAAPNSTTFIVGRAIAGLGASGIFSGAIVLMMAAVPLHKRPMYIGFMGAIFGVASVVGPLLGGVLTTDVSWRWCFYINLPIGGLAIVVITAFTNLPIPKRKSQPLRKQLQQLDPLGTLCFIPGIICLLFALQWGGTKYPWSDGRIIALLVISVILMIGFMVIQIWKQETATIPPRIFKQRSVMAGMWWTTCIGASMMTLIYYLPIWFQAIKGVSAMKSGIMIIPMLLSLTITAMLAGFLTRKIGYYTPWMLASSVIMPIGAGMLTTFKTKTTHSAWIGYQVLYGLGLGLGMQQANVGVQTALPRQDVPTGAALMFFCQSLGGTVFVSVANNIFVNRLFKGLQNVGGIDPALVVHIGATDLRRLVKSSLLTPVLEAYNGALIDAFYVCVGASSVAFLGALFMEWKSVKKGATDQDEQPGLGSSKTNREKAEEEQV